MQKCTFFLPARRRGVRHSCCEAEHTNQRPPLPPVLSKLRRHTDSAAQRYTNKRECKQTTSKRDLPAISTSLGRILKATFPIASESATIVLFGQWTHLHVGAQEKLPLASWFWSGNLWFGEFIVFPWLTGKYEEFLKHKPWQFCNFVVWAAFPRPELNEVLLKKSNWFFSACLQLPICLSCEGDIHRIIIIITVGDLVPSQVCDRSSPILQLLGLSVPNCSKPFSTDLELV